jgi:6-phosphogluconolactonase
MAFSLYDSSITHDPCPITNDPLQITNNFTMTNTTPLMYVGTYTAKDAPGIFVYRVDAGGALTKLHEINGLPNPTFLAIHPSKKFLYAVNEVGDFGGKPAGAVSAFAIQPDGSLVAINQQSSVGSGPCHIIIDRAGKNALVANYGSGSAAVLPINDDGSLAPASSFVQHTGAGPDASRQEGPHAHSATLSPDERFAYVADLGLDKLMTYRFDGSAGALETNVPPHTALHAGAGPRHFVFHPKGRWAYVINELDNTVVAYDYSAGTGALGVKQTITTLPAGWKGTSYCADIHISPDGKFLYGSNRGHDSIVIYAIARTGGLLSLVGHQAEGITWPRNFAIDPAGAFMYVANQNSDSVIAFEMNASTGALTPTSIRADVPKPVCIQFLTL